MIGAGVNAVSPPYTRTPTPDQLEFRAQKPETWILGNSNPETLGFRVQRGFRVKIPKPEDFWALSL